MWIEILYSGVEGWEVGMEGCKPERDLVNMVLSLCLCQGRRGAVPE